MTIVESQQKWIGFVTDERKYRKEELEVHIQNLVESRVLCRICLGDIQESEPNQIDSVYALPEKIKDLFLNVRQYETHPNIPERFCATCSTEMQVSNQILEACEAMQVIEKTEKQCLICEKECKSKYHNGMKELTSLILILIDVQDQETVDDIRNSQYCDSCILSLQIAKNFRYKSYKTEEVLKLQFEQYLKVPENNTKVALEVDEVEMDVDYLEDYSPLDAEVEKKSDSKSDHQEKDVTVGDSEEESDFFSLQLNSPPTQIMHKCPQCPAAYGYEPDLIIHFDILHNTEGTVCNECGLTRKSIASLRQHKLRIHYEVYDHICEICGRQFPAKAKYLAHFATHFDERNFPCNLCPSTFKTKKALNLHIRSHTGEKPYSCEVCHKRFSHHSDMKRHTYTHKDERPYNCEVCQKGQLFKCDLFKTFFKEKCTIFAGFIKKALLMNHLLIHTKPPAKEKVKVNSSRD